MTTLEGRAVGMDDWLLFLGAGASMSAPSCLPAFRELATGVLRAIGWTFEQRLNPPGQFWTHPIYPSFPYPAVTPEVLFGTLRRFGVRFADQVATVLGEPCPNAAHVVAAAVLRQGGCVWTTNVDRAVERACREEAFPLKRTGRASERAPALLLPLRESGPGMLVKFHGTSEALHTLAFTDGELLAPLSRRDFEHLAKSGQDRTVVLYGYAGADADLADLLSVTFARARRVVWFEPSAWRQDDIRRAFPATKDWEIRPREPVEDMSEAVVQTAVAFMDFVAEAGINPDADKVAAFIRRQEPPEPPTLVLEQPPGVTHARLVERFGLPNDETRSLRAARIQDLRHLRLDSVRGHLRSTLGRSLYGEHLAARVVRWLAGHRDILLGVRPQRLRNYLITRACAVLSASDWQALASFADWAVAVRSDSMGQANPSDLYYRAHARRYALQPALARADADRAAVALAHAQDPERLAGAIYEAGSAAIYLGRFDEARRYAFRLRYREGRYAIGRWQAWGAWLDAIALCHLGEPNQALEQLEAARGRFEAEKRVTSLADIRSGELLAARVQLALGGMPDLGVLHDPSDQFRRGRYRDDLDLLIADISLAKGDLDDAARRLRRVAAEPSCPVAATWSALGRAELARLYDDVERAADAFASIAADAERRGAVWLQAQAAIGLALCHDDRVERIWISVRRELPASLAARVPEDLVVGEPRVLWMMTV